MYDDTKERVNWFYSHVICLGTKIQEYEFATIQMFYSHVICLGTKIATHNR